MEKYFLIACLTDTGVTLDAFLQSIRLWHSGEHLSHAHGTKNSMGSDCFEYGKIVALISTFFICKVGAKFFTKHPLELLNNTRLN